MPGKKMSPKFQALADKILGSGKRLDLTDANIQANPMKNLSPTIRKIILSKIGKKDGGDVPMPKRRPKDFKKTVEKQKKERAVAKGKVTVGGLNEMTDYDKEQFLKSKKMKLGGEAKPLVGNQFKLDKNKNGRIDGGDFAKMEMGGEATQIKNKTKAQKQMDAYKKRTADSLAKTEKNRLMVKMGISSGFGSDLSEFTKKKKAERISNKMKKNIPVKKMEMGGKVEEYGGGGKVKGGKMTCRGMGAAVKGGGFSIS